MIIAPKRMHIIIWNFVTFPKYQKHKKLEKDWVQMFNPTPPGEGGMKNEVIEKSIGELKLQNMIFRTYKNKTKSKIWALYLKNWASYGTFRDTTWGENLYQARFSNLKLSSSFEIWVHFFASEPNS